MKTAIPAPIRTVEATPEVTPTPASTVDAAVDPTDIDATTKLAPPKCEKYMLYLLNTASLRFETGRASLSPDSATTVARLAHVAQRCPESKLEVSGHTDNIGDAASNSRLSRLRAQAVVAALARGGVEAPRLTAVGFGAEKPIASNDTDEGRAKNRRIEIHVQ